MTQTSPQRGLELLDIVINNSPALISYVGADHRYRWCNRAYTEWFNRPAESVVGREMREVVGEQAWSTIGPRIDAALAGESIQYEAEAAYQDAGKRWIHAIYTPHRDEAGTVLGIVVMVHDISEIKESERRLKESRERFDLVREGAQIGFWFCDLPFDTLIWDNRVKEHFSLPPSATVTIDLFYDRLHPDDREPTRRAIDDSIANRTLYDIEYRTVAADGREKWIRAIGRTFYNVGGDPIRFDGVTLDVTERKMTENALKESDRRKDEFLAMLAHELRNPLAPIRNATEVLKVAREGDPSRIWARDVIERQTQHITRLVDDLLDVSRITQSKIALRLERLDAAAILERSVEASRPLIDARQQHLLVTLNPLASVEGDQTRLVQVFSNLLNNASKFTDEGGQISLVAAVDREHLVVTVHDSGVGIAPELLPHVFDLFTQADRSLDRSQGGLGIGLTLVRLLVDLHGGTVEAQSEGLGRGSQFTVRLPLAVTAEAGQAASTGHVADSGRDRSRRILLVEDNADSAEMLSVMLGLHGYETEIAHDGESALGAAARFAPHIVCCDIGLPRMSGYDVARELRAILPATSTLIALSGYGQDHDRARSAEAGFDHHLTKPVEPEVLFALLDGVSTV